MQHFMQHMIVMRFCFKCFYCSHRKSSTKKRCCWKFRKVCGKTHVLESLFLKLQLYWKETPKQVFSHEFCKIFVNNYFTEHLLATAKSVHVFMKKSFCFKLTRGRLNTRIAIFHWKIYTFVCILSLYSRYFGTVLLLKIESSEVSPGNILHFKFYI